MNGLYTLEQVATRMSLSLLLLAGAVAGAAETGPLPATLQNAPVNRWVKVVEMKTGAREQPVFVYAAKAGRFVAAAGMQSYFGGIPRHYDTEELDLGQAKWFNAYPPGMDKDRP